VKSITLTQRSALIGAAAAITVPLIQFLCIPMLYKQLGPSAYGLWILINTALAMSGVLLVGTNESLVKYIAAISQDDKLQMNSYIRTLVSISASISCLVLMLMIVGGLLIDFHQGSSESLIRLESSWKWVAMLLFCRMIQTCLESIIKGLARYDIEASIAIISALGILLGVIVVARAGGQLRDFVAVFAAINATVVVCEAFIIRKLYGSWRFCYPQWKYDVIWTVASFSRYTWLQNVGGVITLHADKLIVGSLLGTAVLGVYSICLQIATALSGLVSRSSAVVFNHIVRAFKQGHDAEVTRLVGVGMAWTTIIGGCAAAFLFVFAPTILSMLLSAKPSSTEVLTLRLLACWIGFGSNSPVLYFILNGTGHEKTNTILAYLSNAMLLGCLSVFVPSVGIIGAAASRCATVLVNAITRHWVWKKVLGVETRTAGLETMLPWAAGGIVCFTLLASSDIEPILAYFFACLSVILSALAVYGRRLMRISW
jgi:O-antigen/teichoic acid export membrane protein